MLVQNGQHVAGLINSAPSIIKHHQNFKFCNSMINTLAVVQWYVLLALLIGLYLEFINKTANINVVFDEIYECSYVVLALKTVFEKLGFQEEISKWNRSWARNKISLNNKTIIFAF